MMTTKEVKAIFLKNVEGGYTTMDYVHWLEENICIAKGLCDEVKKCESGFDKNQHQYIKVPARSLSDLGYMLTHWLE